MSWLAPLCAGAASALLIALMLRLRWDWALDRPNDRSLHTTPVPRTGGLGILAGAAAGLAVILAQGGVLPLYSVCLPAAPEKAGPPAISMAAAKPIASSKCTGRRAHTGKL